MNASRSPALAACLTTMLLAPAASARAAPPLSLVLALDTSGSLGPLSHADRARLVEEVVASLPEGSEVAVIGFDDVADLLLPWTTDRAAAVAAAVELGAAGRFTSLHDAIFDASRYQSEAVGERRAILLVSDGLDENSALTLEDGVDTARELGIPVYTYGLGRVRERVLRRIAKLTDGDYFAAGAAGRDVAARILERTPSRAAEVASAAAAPAATEPRGEGASGLPRLLSRGVFWTGWAIAAILAVGSVVAFAIALRRRPQEPAWGYGPSGATGLEPEQAPATTLVERLDSMKDVDSPTMVLTLKPLLHVMRGPDSGRFFEMSLESAVSIGRAPGNDVVLSDRAVSSQHCRVRPTLKGEFELFDLDSTNGTWVNARRIGRHPLAPGDLVKVGETVLQFRMDHLKDEAEQGNG
jgi:hypothetical protein